MYIISILLGFAAGIAGGVVIQAWRTARVTGQSVMGAVIRPALGGGPPPRVPK